MIEKPLARSATLLSSRSLNETPGIAVGQRHVVSFRSTQSTENDTAMDQASMPLLRTGVSPLHEPVSYSEICKDDHELLDHSCSSANEDPIMLSLQRNTTPSLTNCAIPLGSSPIGQALAAPRKETYCYLRNATMTAASAVLLLCEFGVHYYAQHESTQRLPWSSAERSILVFLASTFCYRAGMNLVMSRQSTFVLLLPELLTLLSLFLGILHALRLASLCLVFGSIYLMIFALSSTIDKFMAMSDKMTEEAYNDEKAVQRSRSV